MNTVSKVFVSPDIYAEIGYWDEDAEPEVCFTNIWESGGAYLSLSEWREVVPIITAELEKAAKEIKP